MYDIEKIIKHLHPDHMPSGESVDVVLTQEEFPAFAQALEDAGILWCSGDRITEHHQYPNLLKCQGIILVFRRDGARCVVHVNADEAERRLSTGRSSRYFTSYSFQFIDHESLQSDLTALLCGEV